MQGTAVGDERGELRTGLRFRQTLAQPIDAVSWKGKSLRGSLHRVTETQHIAILLDRRIDPDQTIEFSARGVPLERMLQQLAEKNSAAASRVDSVVYFGPPKTAELLATVVELRREQIAKLSPQRRAALLRAAPWQWKRLTDPRDLLAQLESEYDVRIVGKENMPHDLWPAKKLPPLDFAAKLSLVLAGFHVTFDLSPEGDAARLAPMPQQASLLRRYDAGGNAKSLATRLGAQYSDAKISNDGRQLVVDGRWEVHDAIARLLSGERVRTPPTDTGEKNYTLTVENKPVGGVIRALGNQLGKTVEFDVTVERRLTKDISINVKEVSLDELLTAVLSPAALKYEIEGETIRVFD